jgi:hypothetical protein
LSIDGLRFSAKRFFVSVAKNLVLMLFKNFFINFAKINPSTGGNPYKTINLVVLVTTISIKG